MGELMQVFEHQVARHRAVGIALREGKAGAGRGERLEAERLQVTRAANVPGIGNDEAAALMQLAEGLALVGDARHGALVYSSMAVPWLAGLRHALELHRRLEHHALGELVDNAALDLLPRRLAG